MGEARGFWSAEDRTQSITLRELRAVRLLLARSFAEYVSDCHTRHMVLHEDNQAVVFIINAMVSASRPMMAELRKLRALLHALGIVIEACWIPSAVNRFSDMLSRTWDLGDVRASESLVASIRRHYHLGPDIFARFPMGETIPARAKQMRIELEAPWNDGRAHLWNPPADFLPLVLRKIEEEKPHGVLLAPYWPAQPWLGRLHKVAREIQVLHPNPDYIRAAGANDRWRVAIALIN